MKIHRLIRRGHDHRDFCEDFAYTGEIGEDFFVGAIFDGCSTGKESHFASSLLSKLLSSIVYDLNVVIPYLEREDVFKTYAEEILYILFNKLKRIKSELNLKTEELLSTIILSVYNKKDKSISIFVIGDGFLSVDGKRYEIDQNNVPNYLAYHLDSIDNKKDFDEWLQKEENCFHLQEENVEDFSISSDGIFSFIKKENNDQDEEEIDPIDFLIDDERMIKNSSMLGRKVNILKNQNDFSHYDDLAIIRIKNDEN